MTLVKPVRTAFALLLLLVLLASCRPISNYGASGPIFSGGYGSAPLTFAGDLKVVTWNIRYAEKIPAALDVMMAAPELQDADIILLQEMDEEGVQALARGLGYQYVYVPASIHTYHDRNFGNAILARWPITAAERLILPHSNPKNDQIRIATKASVWVGEHEVLTYSVHTETFWLPPNPRYDQVDTLIADIQPSQQYVLVGGDFNTLTPMSVREVVDRFELAGFTWASESAQTTMTSDFLPFTTDFIFTKNMTVLASGSIAEVDASDHRPVWADLRLE